MPEVFEGEADKGDKSEEPAEQEKAGLKFP